MVRSGTSPALNYGEAQSAESTNDFVHKLKIILKELRETLVCLKIIKRKPLITPVSKLTPIIRKNNELISIFVKSTETAKKMRKNKFPVLLQIVKTSLFKIPCSVFIIIINNYTNENKFNCIQHLKINFCPINHSSFYTIFAINEKNKKFLHNSSY